MLSIKKDESYTGSIDAHAAQAAFKEFITALGLNPDEENLRETPFRMAKMFTDELLVGGYSEPPSIKSFPTPIGSQSDLTIIQLNDIPVKSLCAHHFMPITGNASILAVFQPDDSGNVELPGLSKYAAVVRYFSRRPQLQERLTQQVTDYLYAETKAVLVGVRVSAKHHCMSHRGVETHPEGETITIATRVVSWQDLPSHTPAYTSRYERILSMEQSFRVAQFRCG